MRFEKFLQLMGIVVLAGSVGCSTAPKNGDVDSSAGLEDDDYGVDSSTYSASAGTTASHSGSDGLSAQDKLDAKLLKERVVFFDFDKSTIKPEAYPVLKAHARKLAGSSGIVVRLEGHADERGTREYNLALGEARGNAVAKFLRINGVSSRQLDVVSYGEEKPSRLGHNEESWAENRRVEISYRTH